MALRIARLTAAGGDDFAALQERVGDGDRLIEQTAGVGAKVDNITVNALAEGLIEFSHCLMNARV
jgi:hypothetical protein